ncbi:MAG: hypothetical protein JXX28_16970 [Deltaproteobacteria bacterium]|nr:hypothetical protein [Deltaproteobacteria bacterium]
MSGWLHLGLGCALVSTHTDVRWEDAGWTETVEAEILATDDRCDGASLDLEPGVRLSEERATAILWDDTKVPLPQTRWERTLRDETGRGAVRVFAPELHQGARLRLELERHLPGAEPWEARGETTAVIDLPKGVSATLSGEPVRGRRVRLSDPQDTLRLTPPEEVPALLVAPHLDLEGAPVTLAATRTMVIPRGAPLVRLMPGQGSWVEGEDALRFSADSRRGLILPLPPGHSGLSWEGSLVERGGAVVERDDSLAISAPPGEVALTVRWTAPDATAWGTAPQVQGAEVQLQVLAPQGEVRWDGDAGWWLASWDDQQVLPGREALTTALDARFRAAAVAQPGLPLTLKGAPPGEELAAALRPALWQRVRVVQLPEDPRRPRPLLQARRSGVMSPVEATLTLWAFALQGRMRADWALVHPSGAGTAGEVIPAGFDEGLVRVDWGAGPFWIDPSCPVCAPFEVRPWLEDAPSIGAPTPPLSPGRWAVEESEEGVRWLLSGPPALALRLALAQVPGEEQRAWLAARVGGEGAELLEVSGLDQPGYAVWIATTGQSPTDPLRLTGALEDRWMGTRSWSRPGACERAREATADYAYTRACEGGRVEETLHLKDRSLSPLPPELAAARRLRPLSR